MKAPLLTLALLLTIALGWAQPSLRLNWETPLTNAAGPAVIELIDVVAVAGGAVAVGQASGPDGIQMYAAAYDLAGNLSWELTLPSDARASLSWAETDAQGNLFVAGEEATASLGQPTVAHLAKISSSGQLLWHQTYQGPQGGLEDLNYFRLANGHLYACGVADDPEDFQRGWLARFDLDGNLVWEQSIDPDVYVWLGGLAVDPQGNVTVVGSADSDYAFLAMQYDASGNFSWQFPDTLTGGNEKWLTDVAVDDAGNVYAVGTEEVGAFFEYDIVTLKLDPQGNLLWQQYFSEGGENAGSAVRLGANGTLYAFGTKEDDFDDFAQLIAYDSLGQMLWETDYAIDGNTSFVWAELDANDQLYLAVQTFDSLGFAAFSPTGNFLASKNYGQETVDYVSGLALSGNAVFGTAYSQDGLRSQLFSLQKSDLSENFAADGAGQALSDVNPRGLVSDGQHLWLSSFADDGDSASFTIQQFDLSGTLQWTRTKRHETSNPGFPRLIHDHSGHVIGLYDNLITGGNTPLGLVKYDATGNEVFAHYLDSAATLVTGGLAVDANDNLFVAFYNQTARHMRLSQYNPSGSLQWTRTYLSPSATFPYIGPFEMAVTAQDKLVMAAVEKGADERNNLHLLQFDLSGNVEWDVQVDTQFSNLVTFSGMEVRANGEVCVFGSSGGSTWVAACYDANGSLVWEAKAGTSLTGFPRSLTLDDQGNAYLGFSSSTAASFQKRSATGALLAEAQFSVPSSGSFFFPWQLAWVNAQLVVLGEHLMPGRSVPFELLLDADLNLDYLQVDSSRVATPVSLTLDGMGNIYGAWALGDQNTQSALRTALINQYTIGTVGIEAEATWAWQVYPNPAREFIRVKLEVPQTGFYQFGLYDLQGRRQLQENAFLGPQAQAVTLSLPAGLAPGLYVLQVTHEGHRRSQKVVVR